MTNGTNYYDMNGTFDEPGLSHTVYVGGLSNGAQTYYIKCIDRSNRISGEFTHNFTINAAGSSEGGGGGGGSITTVPNPSASKKWIDVKSSTENIMSINNDEIAFTNLTFVLNKNTSSVELTVESLKDTETIVSNSTLYKILEISEKDIEDTDYESVSIKFKVPRSWITANSSSASHIKLYKYTTKWIQLPTELIGQRSGYYQYQATSVSFSKFAIVSITPQVRQTEAESEQEEIEVIQEPVEQEPNAEPEQEAPQTHKKEISKIFVIIIFLVVISAFVGAIIGYKKYDHMNSMKNIEKYISHQKQKTKSITKEHHHTDLENFVKNCKSRGISREFVKKALLDAGWPEDIVDYYLVKYL